MKLIKLNLLLAVTMIIVTSGCLGHGKKNRQRENNSITGIVNSRNKDYYGIYEGILPCADCSGIKTTLRINSDTTYDLQSEFLGEENRIFEESGVYNMIGENIIELVTPSSGVKTYYKILDDAVVLSDSMGTFNNGGLAEQYVLKRQ